MCGIAGLVGVQAEEKVLRCMLATMRRRGPDGNGVYKARGCTMLHARLAIIDPDGGRQPMTLERDGQRYALVYNGELYNTGELRAELEHLGHSFLGHSDTEVVLHSYAQWGAGCLDRFNGIFAFAVWEEKRKRLFIARDRIGVKPFFFTQHQGGLVFASEIKTILACPSVPRQLDAQGIAEVLLLGPGRTPGCGVLRGIRELEPGWWGFFEGGKLTLRRYWQLRDREHRDSFEETVEKVRWLLMDSIRRQMVSDVPIGTFLSGGLDSSIITAVCAGEMKKRGERLHTFSVDYVDQEKYFVPGKFQPNSDTGFIRLMERFLDTDHHWTVLSPEELADTMEDATFARDLPGMADVDFSLLAFCRQIRGHVKVGLSGECADEIFGGYPWYRDPEVRARAGFPWAQSNDRRIALMKPSLRQKLDPDGYIRERYEATCRESDIPPGTTSQERRMKEMVNLNFRWFMQTLLERKDRMSMYSGLEVRVPFCDYRIAEYLYGVPWEYKDRDGFEKGLLRHGAAGLLPEEVLWRKKSPYPKTHDPRYAGIMYARLEKLLETKAPVFELLDRDAVRSLLTQQAQWPWYGQLMTGPQTAAYLLQLNFWLESYGIDLMI